MRQRLYKGDHPETAKSLGDVGFTFITSFNYQKAVEYKLKQLEMYQRLYKNDEKLRKKFFWSYPLLGIF